MFQKISEAVASDFAGQCKQKLRCWKKLLQLNERSRIPMERLFFFECQFGHLAGNVSEFSTPMPQEMSRWLSPFLLFMPGEPTLFNSTTPSIGSLAGLASNLAKKSRLNADELRFSGGSSLRYGRSFSNAGPLHKMER